MEGLLNGTLSHLDLAKRVPMNGSGSSEKSFLDEVKVHFLLSESAMGCMSQ